MSYIKAILFNVLELFVLIFLITILYYFNIINDKTFSILKLIILLFSIFINSFILGKNTKKKSYLEGIIYGIILITILLLITLILSKVQIKLLVFYPLILLTSIFGSIIGGIKKIDQKWSIFYYFNELLGIATKGLNPTCEAYGLAVWILLYILVKYPSSVFVDPTAYTLGDVLWLSAAPQGPINQ